MPAASFVLMAVIIGAAAGSAATSFGTWCGIAACAWLSVRLRRYGRLAVAAPLLIGAASAARATAHRWQDEHCRALMIRSPDIQFVTDFDLQPGDAGPAQLRAHRNGCTAPAILRARTAVTGGLWYRTTTQVDLTERGLQLDARKVTITTERALRPALRAAGVRRVDSIFTVDAPMARALLLADMHLIPADMRRRWARSGLVHLLSVSGVHVAIIATALLMLASAARLPRRTATLVALGITTIYVLILGLPPPAVRAAVMFGSVLLARLRQRPASEWSVLVLGALLPVLVDPAAPLDLGWQLSVLGVIALAAAGHLVRRLDWQGADWRATLRREFVASTIASVASAPIIAWYFGTVSLIAPIANLVAAPLVTVLQPTLFLALVCAPNLALARFIAGAAHPVLALLDGIAATGARPAWAAVDLSPTLDGALLAAVIVGALLSAMVRRDIGPPLLVAMVGGVLLSWHDLLPARGPGQLELHLLDVGQGDALALRTPRGRWILVDAGGGAPGVDRGRRTVLPYLRRHGGEVAAFVLSHPHLDHVGGAPALIGATSPAHFLDGAFAGGTAAYRASLESAAVHRVRWQRVQPGDSIAVDDVTLRFLAPDSTWTAHLDDANLASVVVRVEYGRAAFLLTGDAEAAEEQWLLHHAPRGTLRADVLKVAHHGSRTSSGDAFLDAVAPSIALISVGRGNRYGHPSPEVVGTLARRQIAVVRTDVVGTAIIRTDGRVITVSTAADRWSQPFTASARGPDSASSRR